MSKVSLASVEKAPIVGPPEGTSGTVETRAVLNRDNNPIHLYQHRLAPGASMRLVGTPTDRVVYVWEGAVDAGGEKLAAHSSAIVERGAVLELTARGDGAVLLAFGMKERSAEARDGGHVHLLPYERVPRADNIQGHKVGMALHADAQCPTCRLWLHENDFNADQETVLHSHSEDEVIFVIGGNIRLGDKLYGPGTALAIAADVKYGFFSGPDGLSFINFRGTSPTYRAADGSMVLDEAELWRSAVGSPHYLEPHASGPSHTH